jgi:hypothetical protein
MQGIGRAENLGRTGSSEISGQVCGYGSLLARFLAAAQVDARR